MEELKINEEWKSNYEKFRNIIIHDSSFDNNVEILLWAYKQKEEYNNGKLNDEQVWLFESLPKWKWKLSKNPNAPIGPCCSNTTYFILLLSIGVIICFDIFYQKYNKI